MTEPDHIQRIRDELRTHRSIPVYCDRHPGADLAVFESHSPSLAGPLGLRELWRIAGTHVTREIRDDATVRAEAGGSELTDLPERILDMLGGSQRYAVRCPNCGQNFELSDLLLGSRRRETFRRLTGLADRLEELSLPGVSRVPLSRLAVMLTS